jgi:hypothetical protein
MLDVRMMSCVRVLRFNWKCCCNVSCCYGAMPLFAERKTEKDRNRIE